MTEQILAVLTSVSTRLADPRAWLQGEGYDAFRDHRGKLWPPSAKRPANCCCVGHAVNEASRKVSGAEPVYELRQAVAEAILATVKERTGREFPNLAHWNDDPATSHREVLETLAQAARVLRNPLALPHDVERP